MLCYNALMDNMNDNNAPVTQGNKKQSSKILIASVVALLVGAAAASAVFIGINGGLDFGKKNTTSNNAETAKPVEDDSVLSQSLIHELAYKTNRIFAISSSAGRYVDSVDTTGDMDDYKKLPDELKATIVIRNAIRDGRTEMMNVSDLGDSEIKTILQETGLTTVPVTKVDDDIKADYKNLFGADFTNQADSSVSLWADGSWSGCAIGSVDGVYVQYAPCGGYNPGHVNIYQYKYEVDGGKVYVYFATQLVDDQGKIYKDLERKNLLAGEGNMLNHLSTEYEKYNHYRAVFEKNDDGNYIYKTVEEVND